MVKERRSGSRNWTRGVFAFFWIVLAGLSGVYLFSVFSDPSALGGQFVRFPGGGSPAASDEASGSLGPDETRDPELAEIKASLRELAQQMAELNTRLKPIEKVVGPVAALPSASSITTSAPTPEPVIAPGQAPASPINKPEATSASSVPPPPAAASAEQAKAKPVEAKPAEKPVEVAKPAPAVETKPSPTPPEEAKPTQQAALEAKPAAEAKPSQKPAEPPSVAVAPLDEDIEEGGTDSSDSSAANDVSAPAPAQAEPSAAPSAAGSNASTKPAGTTESASLDPVALPPAANDGSTRYGIEIGVVAKQDGLRPLWREFLTNHAALVAGLQPRRVLAPDKKWRLIAGPFSNAAEAAQACALFKKASRPCEATVYAGDAL